MTFRRMGPVLFRAALALSVGGRTLSAATVVVNDAGDALHSPGCAVSGTGTCTLRDAITYANVHPGADAIHFNLSGAGVRTIRPTSNLPSLDDNAGVVIDGYTQPGATPNTLARGNDAHLLVEVDGSDIPSGLFGLITAFSDNNTVRGLVVNRYGIEACIGISGSANTITGNFIGTDPTGMIAAPARAGLEVFGGSGNVVGGPDPASRNVIVSGDLGVVYVSGLGSNVVQGNYVGTNAQGTASLGSMYNGGILVESAANLIGGTGPGEGNLVSGNGTIVEGLGIYVGGTGNVVAGNLVGTDRDGIAPIPNTGPGIVVDAVVQSAVIFGNVVAFNGADGVLVSTPPAPPSTGTRISQNSIWSNGGLGIQVDSGGPVPALSSAASDGVRTFAGGSLQGAPDAAYRVEFFASPACDPSGSGEGQTFLGAATVTTDGSGIGTFAVALAASDPGVLTATATDPYQRTSQFSACVPVAFSVQARIPALGPEFRVNTYTTGGQDSPGVAVDPEGRYVIVWRSNGQLGAAGDIFGQRYDAFGDPLGGEFPVNTVTAGDQLDPSVAVDALGNFVVAWAGDGIVGRRFNAAGAPQSGEIPISTAASALEAFPKVARNGAGDFIVVWQAFDGDAMTWNVVGRLWDPLGVPQGGEIPVSTSPAAGGHPGVAMNASGHFTAAWASALDGSLQGVSGRRFDDAGSPIGGEFPVNAFTAGAQVDPSIGMDAAGRFVVAWASGSEDGSGSGIFGRRFDAGGLPIDDGFAINVTTADDQSRPRLAMDDSGNFVVAWTSRLQDGSGDGIFGRHYDAAGRPVGTELRLNATTAGDQAGPEISLNDAGRFVVAWTDGAQDSSGSGIFARRGELRAAQPMRVDVHGSGGTSNRNGVLESGESVVVEPAWKDTLLAPVTFTATASGFAGPAGPVYSIGDATADYATIPPGMTADCYGATPAHDCYVLSVTGARPASHWDATFDEALTTGLTKTWTLHVGGSFADASPTSPFYAFIEGIFHNGVTNGCGSGNYCPSSPVRRDQMAVFLLKAKHGPSYAPPACAGVFADVPCPSPFADWIERLSAEGVTAGCGGGNYCPGDSVTRQQMAVFLLKAEHPPGYAPPACAGIFGDVPCPSTFADWVEQLYAEAVTGGCSASPLLYCPTNLNNRGQMAVFLTRTFGLLLYGP